MSLPKCHGCGKPIKGEYKVLMVRSLPPETRDPQGRLLLKVCAQCWVTAPTRSVDPEDVAKALAAETLAKIKL